MVTNMTRIQPLKTSIFSGDTFKDQSLRASSKISKDHIKFLEQSNITAKTAMELGIKTSLSGDSLLIPFYDLKREKIEGYSVRYDKEAIVENRYPSKSKKKTPKYVNIGKLDLYFPHLETLDWKKIATNINEDLYFAESTKQAIAIAQEGYNAIGLTGSNAKWEHKNFSQFKLKDRNVYLVFDGDKTTNTLVRKGESTLKQYLEKQGARVFIIDVPVTSQKASGIDDYLAANTNRRCPSKSLFQALQTLSRQKTTTSR
jgi:hypothetical protein